MAQYGTDIYCATGFVSSMPEIDDRVSIAHVACRGLQTPNGMIWRDWGEDLRTFALSKVRPQVVAARAKRQLLRDERIRTCKVTATRDDAGTTIELLIAIVPEEVEPFSMVMTVTAAKVTLVKILQEAA